MSERWVDVAHEALIRGWPRLRGWIEEDRAGLRLHRRLTEAAQDWHKSGDESALYRGARLSQAVEWRERNAPSLNELERAFLDASVALERHEASVRERRRRRVIFWLSASLVVFAVLAGLAVLQWRQAYRQGQIALARQLGAQADLLRNRPGVLFQFRRLLLATEAMKRLHEVEVGSLDIDLALRRELSSALPHRARLNVEDWHPDVLRLSPDGRNLIARDSLFYSKNAGVWEIATGKDLVRFEVGPTGEVTATLPGKTVRFQMAGGASRNHMPALSGDGKYFVTEANQIGGRLESVAQVWETETGSELLSLPLPGSHSYALSEDGRYLAVSTEMYDSATHTYSESSTRVWDVRAQREIPGSAPGFPLAFSPDGTVMVTSRGLCEVAADLKQVCSWDFVTADVVLSSDGGHAAIGAERDGQNQIEVWSRAAKRMTASVPMPDSSARLLAVTSDGRYVIYKSNIGESGTSVQVYDVAAKVIVSRAALDVRAAVVTPSGQYLIASLLSQDENERKNSMDVWELRPEGGAGLAIAHEDKVIAAGLAPPGVLATVARNGEKLIVRAWDVRTRPEMPERRAEVTGTGAAFAPDGQTFAVTGDGDLEVRRVDDPGSVAKFDFAGPTAVAWSPDGRHLAAQKGRDVRVWDLRSRRPAGQFTLPERATLSALARGGDSLAAVVTIGGEDTRGGVRQITQAWSVANGEELKSVEPDMGRPDGRYRVTPASAGTVSLSESKSGREAFRIPTDETPLALDQEGGYLATISDSNTVRVWFLRQDDLIVQACQRLSRNLSEGEWREYVGDAAYRKTCPKLP